MSVEKFGMFCAAFVLIVFGGLGFHACNVSNVASWQYETAKTQATQQTEQAKIRAYAEADAVALAHGCTVHADKTYSDCKR